MNRRRWALAAGLAVAVVAAVAFEALRRIPDVPAPVPPPASYVAADGVAYEAIGALRLDTWRHRTATGTVRPPAGATAIGVLASCALDRHAGPHGRSAVALRLTEPPGTDPPGTEAVPARYWYCPPVATGMVDVATSRLPDAGGGTLTISLLGQRTSADAPTTTPATWLFTFYRLTPPPTPHAAPPPPGLPARYRAGSLTMVADTADAARATGVWPGQRTATLTLTGGHRLWSVVVLCSSPLAGLRPVTVKFGSRPRSEPPTVTSCGDPASPIEGVLQKYPTDTGGSGDTVTVTFALRTDGVAHVGSWSVGLYHD